MKLEVLMATMNKSSKEEINREEKNIVSNLLIINQSNNMKYMDFDERTKFLTFNEKGSSKSRNRALENASCDICLIADDDVIYEKDYENIILNAFENNPNADIITFQIRTPEGNKFKKNYMLDEKWHNIFTVLKCSSIEIAFKRESIINKNIKFDEDFGLGSKYKVHDEVIFLVDALKKGLKIKYIPITIVIHSADSSGTDYNEHLIKSKGAAFVRMFGIKGYVLNLIFAFRKYNEYKKVFSLIKFLKYIFGGSFEYIKYLRRI